MNTELLSAELLHMHVPQYELNGSAIAPAVMHVYDCIWHVVIVEQQQGLPHSGMAHADAHSIHTNMSPKLMPEPGRLP